METTELITINWPVCVAGLIFCTAGVAFSFLSRGWSALLAFAGMLIIFLFGGTYMATGQLYFWGAASLIALGINILLPVTVARSRAGVGYIAGASLAGALVGMLLSMAGLIIGAMVGAFCGALAFSRTPAGQALQFPSSKSLNYLCAKGLPAVVTMCIFALSLAAIFGF